MYILFSHNSVDELDLDFNLKRTIACENKSLLYSGQLFYDGKLKIVSGTIYNEALIWDLKGKVSQRLIGHEGVLFRCRFDVTGNRLVTCSDDRTVRIWDLAFEPYHGHTNIEASVILHGHTGRVWDAAFVGNYIVSVSEDASCRVWDLTGNCIAVWEGHGSKSVWCFDSNLKYVVTGGGDGGVRLWNLEQLHENRITRDSQLQICNTEFQENLTKQEKEPKHFKIVDANRFFIVTEVGSFLLYDRLTNTPKLLHQDPLFRLSPQLAVCHDLGFCANMNGLLVVMQLNGSKQATYQLDKEKVNGLFSFSNQEFVFLFVFSHGHLQLLTFKDTLLLEKKAIVLPKDFWIVSLNYLIDEQIVLCGSRKGSFAVFDLQESIEPSLVHEALHDSDAVTFIHTQRLSAKEIQLKTVGRDGMYTISILEKLPDSKFQLEITHRTRITKGWLERIVHVKGTTFLLGFFDKYFFIYNESKGYEMFAVQCGGGHRFWDIVISEPSLANTVFAFHRLRKIQYYVKEATQEDVLDPIVQEPFHSLETKSVDFLKLDGIKNIIVSGGEDGILSFHRSTPGHPLERLVFCRKHSGSIRVVNCPPGPIIFTGGAGQELKAWRAALLQNSVSCVEIAAAPTWTTFIETRVMDLDSIQINNEYIVASVNSDSFVQLWKFDKEFTLLGQSNYHNKCVLKSELLQYNDTLYWFTAGTDGRICMWDISNQELNLAQEFKVHQSGVKALYVCVEDLIYILSGGDDIALSLLILDPVSLKYEKHVVESAHDSSIVGVYMNHNQIYSLSIDQRLNEYQLTERGIKFVKATFVEIADCADMAIDQHQVAIVGHGIQVFQQFFK